MFQDVAKSLAVSTDFLLNRNIDDKAKNTIKDNDLFLQFKKIEQLPNDKKKLIRECLDAFVFKSNVQQLFHS